MNGAGHLASRRWICPLLGTVLLAVALWVMTRAWDASLLGHFQFRLTQTALGAYWLQQDGFSLAYQLPIFGPPWSVPMEFPLYQWLVALLSSSTGLSLVSAARLVGIVFFLGTLPPLYGLAGLIESDPRRRLLIPAAVLTIPLCLYYARAFMIESCATAFAVWFLFAHVRSLQKADLRWAAAALVMVIAAALVKITTFAVFCVPAALYALWHLRQYAGSVRSPGFYRHLLIAGLPVGVALAVALRWIAFGDELKQANAYASFLTSENLRGWNYGPLAQRLDPGFWRSIHTHLTFGVLPDLAMLLLALGLIFIETRYRRAALLCAAGYLIGPLLFANLYAVHEYYHYPTAFFAAAAAGTVLAGVVQTQRLGPAVKALVVLVFFVLQAGNLAQGFGPLLWSRPPPPPQIVDVVRAAVPEPGVILVYGSDWNTMLPYYTQRRAILVPNGQANDIAKLEAVLATLGPDKVDALVVAGPFRNQPDFIRWRTDRLGLATDPVARSDDGDLYLPRSAVPDLEQKLQGHNLPQVTFDFVLKADAADSRMLSQPVIAATFAPVTSVAPHAIFTPWSVEPAQVSDRRVVTANAPCELHFTAPAETGRIEATVGLFEGAYAGSAPSDGVDVLVFERLADGGRRVLYQRNLDPVRRPADRGPQEIVIDRPGPLHGPLVFAIYPGPAGNLSCDWGYWSRIAIR
jgi:hypothetical protein